ncbi:MAG: hydroxymethylbilane synthase [Chloroflexi bacterium]|nr:hydroxymethylbilane synthase [Chloroflexota bacterium]
MTDLQQIRQQIRIGTRASNLARWQTDHVAALLRQQHPTLEPTIQVISTKGDEILDQALPLIGGKGLFTEALENALRGGDIDCAVHSLKDLPTEDAPGLVVGAIPDRADVRDVIVSRDHRPLADLPEGATVGTSSRRRAAQLLHRRPDLNIIDIRGNVETRIKKVFADDTPYDATLLAYAGVARLGLSQHIAEVLPLELMLNAPGQGALGIQCRTDADAATIFAPLNHIGTRLAAEAERAFLAGLGGGCSVPVAAFAHEDGDTLHLHGRVIAVDGGKLIDVKGQVTFAPDADDSARTTHALKLAQNLANQARAQGADAILAGLEA